MPRTAPAFTCSGVWYSRYSLHSTRHATQAHPTATRDGRRHAMQCCRHSIDAIVRRCVLTDSLHATPHATGRMQRATRTTQHATKPAAVQLLLLDPAAHEATACKPRRAQRGMHRTARGVQHPARPVASFCRWLPDRRGMAWVPLCCTASIRRAPPPAAARGTPRRAQPPNSSRACCNARPALATRRAALHCAATYRCGASPAGSRHVDYTVPRGTGRRAAVAPRCTALLCRAPRPVARCCIMSHDTSQYVARVVLRRV